MIDKPSSQHEDESRMSVGAAIIIGHIAVTIPVLIILFGFMFVGYLFFQNINWFVFLFLGFVLAWIWWSFMIPRWRIWVHRQGVNPEQLQKWAVLTGLVWPKGWIFEKTEFKVKDEE